MIEKRELEWELKWVQYRMRMLDIIEEKLLQMKQISERAKNEHLNSEELDLLNARLNNLAEQIRAIDEESKKNEYEKII